MRCFRLFFVSLIAVFVFAVAVFAIEPPEQAYDSQYTVYYCASMVPVPIEGTGGSTGFTSNCSFYYQLAGGAGNVHYMRIRDVHDYTNFLWEGPVHGNSPHNPYSYAEGDGPIGQVNFAPWHTWGIDWWSTGGPAPYHAFWTLTLGTTREGY